MSNFQEDNGFFGFLYNYRKPLRVLFIADLLIFPLKVIISPDTDVNSWIGTLFKFGFIPIVGLIYIRKAVKDRRD